MNGPTRPKQDARERHIGLIHFIIIILVVLAAYHHTLRAPFVFDDGFNIVENSLVKDLNFYLHPESAKAFTLNSVFNSRFAGYLTFALNYRLNGLDTTGYHIVNIAIHIANSLVVYAIVILTFKTPYMPCSPVSRNSRNIALAASLLFASHPVATQAVTYIVQRFSSLAALFYFLALWSYIKARLSESRRRTIYYAILYLLAFGAAVKTKENAYTLPVITILYEFVFFPRESKRSLILLPILSAIFAISLSPAVSGDSIIELSGSLPESMKISRHDYLITQFRVIVTYLRLLFLPVDQNLDYDYPVYRSLLNMEVIASLALIVAVIGLAVYLLTRARKGAHHLRAVSFGILWFFIALSVESSVIPLADVIFEHRMYLPLFGPAMAFAVVLYSLGEGSRPLFAEKSINVFLIIVVLVFSVSTYRRNSIWLSGESLWQDASVKSPQKARPLVNLAIEYKNRGKTDNAIGLYVQALKLDDGSFIAHNNLASCYMETGVFEEAVRHYKRALEIQPGIAELHFNLGYAYFMSGELDKSDSEMNLFRKLRPSDERASVSFRDALKGK